MKKFYRLSLRLLLAVKKACMLGWPFRSAPEVYKAGWSRPDPDEII